MITKQSPWLLDAGQITQDVHLARLKHFPLIHHETEFLNYSFKDGVYVVTGPRQIGKSTHLKMLIQRLLTDKNHENFLYFNCDLLDKKQDIVELVEEYLSKFPSKNRRYVLLDEITSVKDSFLAIKFLVDNGYDKNITYMLTGSNTISIKKTGEYLPGRRGSGIDFIFKPISFTSFLKLQHPKLAVNLHFNSAAKEFIKINKLLNLKQALDTYLITGGFPRIINELYQNKSINNDIFTIYRAWITSEIAKADKKEYIAKRVLERCIVSLGSDTSYNAFAQDTDVGSHNTIYDYIDFLANAYVISQIHNYDIHQKKVRYRKNKKIYFNDPFIFAVIEAWLSGKPKQDYDYLKNPILKSRLIENLVFLKCSALCPEVYFHKNQKEIDFVAKDYLFEVKYQDKIIPNDYLYLDQYPGKNKIVITKNLLDRKNNILLLPVECFLLCT